MADEAKLELVRDWLTRATLLTGKYPARLRLTDCFRGTKEYLSQRTFTVVSPAALI